MFVINLSSATKLWDCTWSQWQFLYIFVIIPSPPLNSFPSSPSPSVSLNAPLQPKQITVHLEVFKLCVKFYPSWLWWSTQLMHIHSSSWNVTFRLTAQTDWHMIDSYCNATRTYEMHMSKRRLWKSVMQKIKRRKSTMFFRKKHASVQ